MSNRKSSNYIMTLDPMSTTDMEKLATIRRTISVLNAMPYAKGPQRRVVVRGRRPVMKAEVKNRWTGKTSVVGYDYAGNILGGLSNAQALDVYVYTR